MNYKRCILIAGLIINSCWLTACHNYQRNKSIGKENTSIAEDDSVSRSINRSNENNAQTVEDLALLGYSEIEMAKAAKMKSKNKTIKNLAALLQSDDMVLMKQLKQCAANRNINIPDSATEKDRLEIRKMTENNNSSAFDKEWCSRVLDRHEKLITEMEDAASTVTDPGLRAWINDALPKIRVQRDKLMQLKYMLR